MLISQKIVLRRQRSKLAQVVSAFGLAFYLSLTVQAQDTGRVYYRYINEEGVKVLNYTIPPEFAQKGYEVISASGKVIKVVDPAPDPEEMAAIKAAKKAKEEFKLKYRILKKRYSSIEDIDGAETRKLESINTNIAIQKGNILNINAQIDALSRQAASAERANKKVSPQILESIKELKNQREAVEAILDQRYAKIKETKEKFEADRQLLIRGLILEGELPKDYSREKGAEKQALETEPGTEATQQDAELSASE